MGKWTKKWKYKNLERITIPIEIRKQFQIEEGYIITIRLEKGELKILTGKQVLDHARNLVKPYLNLNHSSVDTFIDC